MAAIAMELQNTHDINISTAVEQNAKGQDEPFFGETADGSRYFGVWDGHGTDNVISELRKYVLNGKLGEFMSAPSPVRSISDELIRNNVCRFGQSSGATMNYGILEGNRLTCVNCGDSRMFVFRNGVLVFQSEEHHALNKKERERLGHRVTYDKSQNIKMVAENKIIAVYSEYVRMVNGNQLALTQALGHNGCADPFPETYEIEIGLTDEIVAVSVSDGVTDMLWYDEEDNIVKQDLQMLHELSAEDLKNKIQARWLQPWTMVTLKGDEFSNVTYKRHECDDIGIARFVMTPKNV